MWNLLSGAKARLALDKATYALGETVTATVSLDDAIGKKAGGVTLQWWDGSTEDIPFAATPTGSTAAPPPVTKTKVVDDVPEDGQFKVVLSDGTNVRKSSEVSQKFDVTPPTVEITACPDESWLNETIKVKVKVEKLPKSGVRFELSGSAGSAKTVCSIPSGGTGAPHEQEFDFKTDQPGDTQQITLTPKKRCQGGATVDKTVKVKVPVISIDALDPDKASYQVGEEIKVTVKLAGKAVEQLDFELAGTGMETSPVAGNFAAGDQDVTKDFTVKPPDYGDGRNIKLTAKKNGKVSDADPKHGERTFDVKYASVEIESVSVTECFVGEKVLVKVKRKGGAPAKSRPRDAEKVVKFEIVGDALDGDTVAGEFAPTDPDTKDVEVRPAKAGDALKLRLRAVEYAVEGAAVEKDIKVKKPKAEFDGWAAATEYNAGDTAVLKVKLEKAAGPRGAEAVVKSTAFDRAYTVRFEDGQDNVGIRVSLAIADNAADQDIEFETDDKLTLCVGGAKTATKVRAPKIEFDGDPLTGVKFYAGETVKLKVKLNNPAGAAGCGGRIVCPDLFSSPNGYAFRLQSGKQDQEIEVRFDKTGASKEVRLEGLTLCVAAPPPALDKLIATVEDPPKVFLLEDGGKCLFENGTDATLPDTPLAAAKKFRVRVRLDKPHGRINPTVFVRCPALEAEVQVEFDKDKIIPKSKARLKIASPAPLGNYTLLLVDPQGCALGSPHSTPLRTTNEAQKIEFDEDLGISPPTGPYDEGQTVRFRVIVLPEKDQAKPDALAVTDLEFNIKADPPIFEATTVKIDRATRMAQKQFKLHLEEAGPGGTRLDTDKPITAKVDLEVVSGCDLGKRKTLSVKLRPAPKARFAAKTGGGRGATNRDLWIDPKGPFIAGDDAVITVKLSGPAPKRGDEATHPGAWMRLKSTLFPVPPSGAPGDPGVYEVNVSAGADMVKVPVILARGYPGETDVDLEIWTPGNPEDSGCREDKPEEMKRKVHVEPSPAVGFDAAAACIPDHNGTIFEQGQNAVLKIKLDQAPKESALAKITSTALHEVMMVRFLENQTTKTLPIAWQVGRVDQDNRPVEQDVIVEPVIACQEAAPPSTLAKIIKVKIKGPVVKSATSPSQPCPMTHDPQGNPLPCNQHRQVVWEKHGPKAERTPAKRAPKEDGRWGTVVSEDVRKNLEGADPVDDQIGTGLVQMIAGREKDFYCTEPMKEFHGTSVTVLMHPKDYHRCKLKVKGPDGVVREHPLLRVYEMRDGHWTRILTQRPPQNVRPEALARQPLYEFDVFQAWQPWHELTDYSTRSEKNRQNPLKGAWNLVLRNTPIGDVLSAIRAFNPPVRKYKVITEVCAEVDPALPAPPEQPAKTLQTIIDVYPSDEFCLKLKVRPFPGMYWGYQGRFLDNAGELRARDVAEASDKVAAQTGGEQNNQQDRPQDMGKGLDTDKYMEAWKGGNPELKQAVVGSLPPGASPNPPLRSLGGPVPRGIKPPRTYKVGDFSVSEDDTGRGPVRQERREILKYAFHAGSESIMAATWDQARLVEGKGYDVNSKAQRDDQEKNMPPTPSQVWDRVSVTLTRNGKIEQDYNEIAKAIAGLVACVQKFGDCVSGLKDIMPSWGFGFQFSLGFLEGDIAWRWGWKEYADRRVFFWQAVNIDATLFRVTFRLDFGARWRALFIRFEVVVYLQISGAISVQKNWERQGPDEGQGMTGESAWLGFRTAVEAGVNMVLLHEGFCRANACIKTGYELKFRFVEEIKGHAVEYQGLFLGVSISATFSCLFFKEKTAEKVLIDGSDPRAPHKQGILFPKSARTGYYALRSDVQFLWRKFMVHYATLEEALEDWYDCQRQAAAARDPADPDTQPPAPAWPWADDPFPENRPTIFEAGQVQGGTGRDALRELHDWTDQWTVFRGDGAAPNTSGSRPKWGLKFYDGKSVRGRLNKLKKLDVDDHLADIIEDLEEGIEAVKDAMVELESDYFAKLREYDTKITEAEDAERPVPVDVATALEEWKNWNRGPEAVKDIVKTALSKIRTATKDRFKDFNYYLKQAEKQHGKWKLT
jgi:hypothetical protein